MTKIPSVRFVSAVVNLEKRKHRDCLLLPTITYNVAHINKPYKPKECFVALTKVLE